MNTEYHYIVVIVSGSDRTECGEEGGFNPIATFLALRFHLGGCGAFVPPCILNSPTLGS